MRRLRTASPGKAVEVWAEDEARLGLKPIGRRGNGAAPKLDPDQRAALLAALKQRPPDGGLWTGPKVAAYVRSRWGVRVCPQTGWQWLRDLGFTLQVPRPSHPRSADRPTRRRWKKTCDAG